MIENAFYSSEKKANTNARFFKVITSDLISSNNFPTRFRKSWPSVGLSRIKGADRTASQMDLGTFYIAIANFDIIDITLTFLRIRSRELQLYNSDCARKKFVPHVNAH